MRIDIIYVDIMVQQDMDPYLKIYNNTCMYVCVGIFMRQSDSNTGRLMEWLFQLQVFANGIFHVSI